MNILAANHTLAAIGSILLSLTVTFLFNYFIGLPKKFKDAKKAEEKEKEALMEENKKRDRRLDKIEEVIDNLPKYRAQSLKIQEELQCADVGILEVCNEIREDVIRNRMTVLEKLERLENREKNALRSKIIAEYRLYTDEYRNPNKAWSEMEAHSFWKLVEDYEALGGNDYVHGTVIPAMHQLRVRNMDNLDALTELYASRRAG